MSGPGGRVVVPTGKPPVRRRLLRLAMTVLLVGWLAVAAFFAWSMWEIGSLVGMT